MKHDIEKKKMGTMHSITFIGYRLLLMGREAILYRQQIIMKRQIN